MGSITLCFISIKKIFSFQKSEVKIIVLKGFDKGFAFIMHDESKKNKKNDGKNQCLDSNQYNQKEQKKKPSTGTILNYLKKKISSWLLKKNMVDEVISTLTLYMMGNDPDSSYRQINY